MTKPLIDTWLLFKQTYCTHANFHIQVFLNWEIIKFWGFVNILLNNTVQLCHLQFHHCKLVIKTSIWYIYHAMLGCMQQFNAHINVKWTCKLLRPSVMVSSWSLPNGEPRSLNKYSFFSHFFPLKGKIKLSSFTM